MRLLATEIEGLWQIVPTVHADDRGLFARTYDEETFAKAGLNVVWPQSNTSFNNRRGTLRGMHYQLAHAPEPKLVRCTQGRIFDVAVDLRPSSPTFKRWFGVELAAEKRNALCIPAGLAHGFLTLEDHSEVFYQMGANYVADAASGVRWNDPAFAIDWPFEPEAMAERDRHFPDFAASAP